MTPIEKPDDIDVLGELADATRLLKAACKLVEFLIPDEDDAQDHILGVLYAVADKIEVASKDFARYAELMKRARYMPVSIHDETVGTPPED